MRTLVLKDMMRIRQISTSTIPTTTKIFIFVQSVIGSGRKTM